MSRKPSGLAAFTAKRPAPPDEAAAPAEAVTSKAVAAASGGERRARGKGETVALTVRVARSDWTRLHSLALSEGTSLQGIALEGFSAVLAKHGLPPMETQ